MPTVWIVNHHAGTPRKAGGTRHYWLAKGLANVGWDSVIITSNEARPKDSWSEGGTGSDFVVDGVKFRSVDVSPVAGHGLARLRSYLAFSARALAPRATRGLPRPDVVIGSTVHPFAAYSAMRLARRHHAAFVFEIRDLWPETLITSGRLSPRSPMAQSLYALEARLVKGSTHVISPLSRCGEYLSDRYALPQSRFTWISNGYSAKFHPTPLHLEECSHFQFGYFGTLGLVSEGDLMLDAFTSAARQSPHDLRFRLFGKGSEVPRLRIKAAATGLPIEILDPIPASEVRSEMAKCQGLVFALPNNKSLYRYGASLNKSFDYLASGVPTVLAAEYPDNPFLESGAGLVVAPGDVVELSQAMCKMASLPLEERRRMGASGHALAEQDYELTRLGERLGSVLDRLPRPSFAPPSTKNV